MSIKESALNTITALTNSDFIRMVTAAGASRKASLQSIAQHIIESYAGSTLAGSQQSVKSALDALNSTLRFLYDNTSWTAPTITGERIAFVEGGYIKKDGLCYIDYTFTNVSTYSFGVGAYAVATGFPVPAGSAAIAPLMMAAKVGDSNVSKLLHAEIVNNGLRITTSAALGAPATATTIRVIGVYKTT